MSDHVDGLELRIRELEAQLEASEDRWIDHEAEVTGLRVQLEAERRAHDATELRLEKTVAQLNHERRAHEITSRQGNATADGLYYELDKERKALKEAQNKGQKIDDALSEWMQRCARIEAETIERCDEACMKLLDTEYPLTRVPLKAAIKKAIRALQPNAAATQEDNCLVDRLPLDMGTSTDCQKSTEQEAFPAPATATPGEYARGLERSAEINRGTK